MVALADLERDLVRALESGDLDQVASVRRAISDGFAASPQGAEAAYKLGLDRLFRANQDQEAAGLFRAAAKANAPPWSLAARISLGLLLLRQGKPQQAIFEFRRVASSKPPTLQAAQAAGFVVMAFRQEKNHKEAERAREVHLAVLKKLIGIEDEETRAVAHFMLAMEHKFDGERQPAKAHFEKALAIDALPENERVMAASALEDL